MISLLLKPDGDWRKRHGRNDVKFEIPKGDAARLKELVEQIQSEELGEALAAVLRLPPAKYPDDQWVVAQALFHVLRHALAELKLLFAERGKCDFTELALAARQALGADDGANESLLAAGGTLRHVLVDEMQDTSSGQYDLLYLLTRTWDGHTQTLFLVGDPKQSIYLFRQARVERFLRIMKEQRLGDIAIRSLQLTSNFRSQLKLVYDFNDTFDLIFSHCQAEDHQNDSDTNVPFVEALPVRGETGNNGVVWHTKLLEKSDSLQSHALHEARAIRRIVEDRLKMPLPVDRAHLPDLKPWRIAVLARAKQHLSAIIDEFKRDHGAGPIPYRAIDLDPLDELPEVLDALALTRALNNASDRIAWLAVLHAPWCGLGLADLLSLTGEGEQVNPHATIPWLMHSRRSLLSASGMERLDRVRPVLDFAIDNIGRTTLATAVERTWRSLGGDAALSLEQRSNVLRYLAILRNAEGEHDGLDLSALQSRLKGLYAEPPSTSCENGHLPVELLTIHKAKGLEWDIVIVPALERGSGLPRSVLLNWQEFDNLSDHGQAPSVVLAPIGQKGTDRDKLSSWLNSVRAQREAAESKRVFYVAATRAREELHLFAASTITAKGEVSKPRYNSLLKACWPAVAYRFERLLEKEAASANLASTRLVGTVPMEDVLDLAAEGETTMAMEFQSRSPTIRRLPMSFDPSLRFRKAELNKLYYPAASALRQTAVFERPEGSFAARAFGNVVHRYLQVVATQLELGIDGDQLLAELPAWKARIQTSLRGEGLPPKLAEREAARATQALGTALRDPVGNWILSTRAGGASERALTIASDDPRSLQVDRTFVAGNEPLTAGEQCIWIVDYKTSEQGSRSNETFATNEINKYSGQLEAYASLLRALPQINLPIRLGLFYPLIPKLIHWTSVPPTLQTPDQTTSAKQTY